jgi:hypothetical protein
MKKISEYTIRLPSIVNAKSKKRFQTLNSKEWLNITIAAEIKVTRFTRKIWINPLIKCVAAIFLRSMGRKSMVSIFLLFLKGKSSSRGTIVDTIIDRVESSVRSIYSVR